MYRSWHTIRIAGFLSVILGIFLCALQIPAAPVPRDKELDKELKTLQGDWILIEAINHKGAVIKHPLGKPDTDHCNIYIQNDRLIVHFDGTDPEDEYVTTFKIDPKKDPKEIELTGVDSTIGTFKAKGSKSKGIYQVEGETLTMIMCWSKCDETIMPETFKPGQGFIIDKYIRSKKPISQDSSCAWQRPK